MKSIFYFFITILVCSTLVSSSQKAFKNIILQSTDIKSSSQLLIQSAKVITSRLKTYGLESSVTVISHKNQIKVQLPENIDISEIEPLLTSKGDLGFYETLTLKEIADASKKPLNATGSEAKLACSTFENKQVADSVENYLKSINLSSDYKLLWGLKNSKSLTCLYSIKINKTEISPLLRSDIETIKASQDSSSESYIIEIKFKPESSRMWAVMTKSNLGKPIAIVIDDKVFYSPVVRSEIESGLCEISGSMSKMDVNFFLALVNNDLLPVKFILK